MMSSNEQERIRCMALKKLILDKWSSLFLTLALWPQNKIYLAL